MNNILLETPRLYLRDFQDSDFAAVHEYGSLPDFSQYEVWGPNTEADTKKFIADSIAMSQRQPQYEFEQALILKGSNTLIGGAHFSRCFELSRVGELGYAINPKYQNQGYATEVSKAFIRFGFEQLNLLVIFATCDTRNVASYRVMEKCGMQRVGMKIGDRKIRGGLYDSYRYEIYAGQHK